ncbi:hypothetical protein CORMATOL_00861 [Corynebacterium matruchotii ATCC 33806]|uniref:Uncharacterized protein n=1 Tax=Corynebacterium matruchotii ATCC 33806 TaxID=566549 RepID=C0E1L0_9CORY|nr:hypothetical protein CORMATOL_00861 [Corynebacterium matruchotii ATCC 33806]
MLSGVSGIKSTPQLAPSQKPRLEHMLPRGAGAGIPPWEAS